MTPSNPYQEGHEELLAGAAGFSWPCIHNSSRQFGVITPCTRPRLATGSVARYQADGYNERMSRPNAPFTAPERDLLRRELCRHFGEDPRVADGIFLRTWRGGERRGQPKIPPAVQTMLERGLVEVRTTNRGPRAFFTEAGLAALRQLVLDRRAMDPERFAHLRIELGLG